jgi:hypothetical protein
MEGDMRSSAVRCHSLLLGACLSIAVAACGKTVWNPALHEASEVPRPDPGKKYLKLHMYSGDVYILGSWTVDQEASVVEGRGSHFDSHRNHLTTTSFNIPLDSVALFESSTRGAVRPIGLTLLGVWTTVSVVVTAYCVADPKACFGSCPTFYVYDGERERLEAEGFSSSIARVLEERDIDALYHAQARDGQLRLRMTNEALETHVVRRVRLHAVPRGPGTHVFATPGGLYYPARELIAPSTCRDAHGDCLDAVREVDALERTSVTDSTDLARRETIQLEFPSPRGRLGLVISARNTFVSTYLLYQTMAYMGTKAGDWLAQLERGDEELKARMRAFLGHLGGIEVEIAQPGGSWQQLGTYSESGPIASDIQVLPFQVEGTGDTLRIRLTLAKGHWRIGYIALASLDAPLAPVVLDPQSMENEAGADSGAHSALTDPDRYLVTYPGDRYMFLFSLPEGDQDFEFFLESQGYYYEWMRDEWLKEENPAMVALLMMNPAEALRQLAPAFKKIEPEMERIFWQSRFGR